MGGAGWGGGLRACRLGKPDEILMTGVMSCRLAQRGQRRLRSRRQPVAASGLRPGRDNQLRRARRSAERRLEQLQEQIRRAAEGVFCGGCLLTMCTSMLNSSGVWALLPLAFVIIVCHTACFALTCCGQTPYISNDFLKPGSGTPRIC